MGLAQVLHTTVQLGAECLQDLQLLLEIGLRQEDTPINSRPQLTHMQIAMAKATVPIDRMRVSVISTIHTMTNRSKDRNRCRQHRS